MLNELLALYKNSLVNQDIPKCRFPETLIFNEGWLLRSVLNGCLAGAGGSRFGFLRFPDGVTAFSEGQLRTPFGRGPHREGNTHVDGIVGDFSIRGTKSGIDLKPELRYIAAFEAKLYSPLSKGVTHAPDYDQVTRTAACLINSVLRAGAKGDYAAHLVVFHAKKNKHIRREDFEDNHIERAIASRLEPFTAAEDPSETIELFAAGWEKVLRKLEVHFLTWEEVVDDIGDPKLSRFYDLCLEFAKPARR